ncbi:M23 family metallopeptidase [Winogradskyella jejuensis]|uniref:Murein DD-endopeptidase MepM and murein hydrolase activator NlpD, contain LysM domain n=1 Tax=Winogradskyella jejuensis TaxID=1089305 RepID=A0A1M5ST99_9FLAO|nr:M23 family metallopeptidase [Winogradskyella jejuensis]SHH41726.1 Murein DD-endopeptidase MepM and murein hydrolase activator NlpD, contain LysM domain [Winogradskyella jejuensis]
MKRCFFLLIFFISLVVGCSKKLTAPRFIKFKVENDSLLVISKNHLVSPMYVKVINRETDETLFKQLEPKEEEQIFGYRLTETDSNSVLKKYRFLAYYGKYPFTEYDTNYVYTLPFQKGYESKIIQGYDGDFSHKGAFSSKCIDFDMAIGDTIVAARDGVVVNVVAKHNKQGVTEDFKNYGNYVMLYHEDNTFSQYVHLKQNGNLVKIGDSVKANQPIALSGFTGWTTVPHLHFGVYKPTADGLVSIPVILDSIPAKTLKRGLIISKK